MLFLVFSHTCVLFLIIVCLLIERNKSFIIKFCVVAKEKKIKMGSDRMSEAKRERKRGASAVLSLLISF